MKGLLLLVMLFPLVAFVIAGIMELRSNTDLVQKIGKLVPIILGIGAFIFSFDPQGFLHVTASSSMTLSRVMTMVCALIACSGSFIVYSRRASSTLVAVGGLVLAFGWMFNQVVV